MKKFYSFSLAILALSLFISLDALAQLDLPQPSPKASVTQVVGLTEVKVEYSSPGKKGREIFGKLVSFGEMWRTGANKATAISFSDDVKIEGKELKAGTYSLFTIPGEKEWTFIFNKETELWGTGNYKEDDDALRVKVKPGKYPMEKERMAFEISAVDDTKGTLSVVWDKTIVSLNIETDPISVAKKNIETMNALVGRLWYDYASAANFYLKHEVDMEKAVEWVDQSIEMNKHFYNRWVKAQIMAKTGKKKEALALAKEAKEIGEESDSNFYKSRKEDIEKAIKDWK